MQPTLEATLAHLISIPSVNSDPAACHDIITFIRQQLEATGAFRLLASPAGSTHPWLIATPPGTLTPDILLAAHVDVVPASAALFTMQKRGERLYGRGVYDMKNAVACYLELIRNHAAALAGRNIGFLFTSDEEEGSASMLEVLATGLRPGVVFLPDGGDNWHVEGQAKGVHGVELTAHGKTAHGSRPWEGTNALHVLLDALADLRAAYPSAEPAHPTLSINKIIGGDAFNQVADSASALLDFRSFDADALDCYRQLIIATAKKYSLDVRDVVSIPPIRFNPQHLAVQGFLGALQRFTDADVRYCDAYGATDARFFTAHDIPTIILEPTGGKRHAQDEWVLASDLARYYEFLTTWLLSSENTKP